MPATPIFTDNDRARTNFDPGQVVERGITMPWASDRAASWMYYDCTVGCLLDSGIVIHNRLPQVDNDPDTLGAIALDDPRMDASTSGINLKCRDQYADIVQRMGHARYWFRLWGQALRIGYQVPIPTLVTIAGVAAVPYDKNRQWAFNRIFPGGNYGGVPLWHAQWSLWFTTIVPPTGAQPPAVDPAARITGDVTAPTEMQAPYSRADDSSTPTQPAPRTLLSGIMGGIA